MSKEVSEDQLLESTRNLLSELDHLAARRPMGNPVLPPVLCIKPRSQSSSVIQNIPNYFWVSANSQKPTIPHVLSILDRPELDDLALFEYIYDNIKIPRSMGRFRLTNLNMALTLLGQTLDPGATSRETKANDLVAKLYRKRRPHIGRTTKVLSIRDGYDGVIGFIAIFLELFRRVRFRVFRAKVATTLQYRWFTDRVALELTERGQVDEVSQDFLSCAIWTLQQPGLHGSSFARDLLMLALFEDLEHAFKSHPFDLSLSRRRRTTPFVITFKEVSADDSAVRRFLQTFGELMEQSKGARLLILASVNGQAPPSLQADIDTARTAADKLHLIRQGHYESSAITAFNIQASGSAKQTEKVRQLVSRRPTPQPTALLSDFTLPVIIGIILTPFLVAGLIYAVRAVPLLYQATQNCKYMHHVSGEVVGITDGSCSFLTPNDARSIGYTETENPLWRQVQVTSDSVKDLYTYISTLGKITPRPPDTQRLSYIRELNDTKQIILSQNRHIRDNDTYRTIVLLVPFTAPDESGHANQKTIGIMRGVAVAQEEINANAERASPDNLQHLKLKVLIANAGDKLAHGQMVARDIRMLNQEGLTRLTPEHSIVAVAGLTQSIAEAGRIADILTRPGDAYNPPIPTIGSTLTYDYMSEGNPLFYQASTPNKRQAQVLGEFIRHQPLVGDISGNAPQLLKPARNIVIINDDNDWYSQNIADDLYHNLTDHSATNPIVGYWAVQNGKPQDSDPHLTYKPPTYSLSTIQSQLCEPEKLSTFDQQQDIIVYTGRSQRFSTFLSALKPDVCPRGKGFTIVAGSDVAQWGEYDTFKTFFPHLYFGAYGSRGSDHNGAIADTFFANPTVQGIVDQSGGARAYDSIKLIWTIVQRTNLPLVTMTTQTVTKELRKDLPIRFEGASGVLDIPVGGRTPVNKPVFVMRAGESKPVLACGLFSIQPPGSDERLNSHGQPFIETKWGNERQFDCP